MKKYYIILCCLLSSIQWIQAQDSQVQNDSTQIKSWTFGVKLGESHTNISKYHHYNYIRALYLGLFVEKRLAKSWAIEGDVIGNFTYYGSTTLEIPIVAKYYFNNSWSVFAGPKLDIYLGNSLHWRDSFQFNSSDKVSILTPSFEIGTQFDMSKHFFIEARYSFGLDTYVDSEINGKWNRNVLKVGVGYKF
ncbi:outer membrane beta-barrel protein [Mangrovimonas sp. TPBH4]|uniref:outer membrane beta-barrel protein n=1 Tax=Mangrovimonas sp. TPBH4 TaxID=1645914 RepID=UPI0006B47AB4|nr:outer membrane beta-barrel protein [Mangrovimonas sp. TPBH4]